MHNYDPGQHFINFANIRITGFADGTYLTVERMTEAYTSVSGASGEVARIRSRDKRGSIKFSLMATSSDNDRLSAVAAKDELDGTGVGVLSMTDGNGTTVVTGSNTWIKKYPSLELSKDMPNRDWELECENLEILVGGTR